MTLPIATCVLKESFALNFIREIKIQVANCFYLDDATLRKRYNINNTHILEEALAQKKNVILLVGHFTTMMLGVLMSALESLALIIVEPCLINCLVISVSNNALFCGR
jgi:lauroyl/myristoyl acyltransferase